jgi:hypothetical protein
LANLAVECDQHVVDDAPDHPQRMLWRNTVLEKAARTKPRSL